MMFIMCELKHNTMLVSKTPKYDNVKKPCLDHFRYSSPKWSCLRITIATSKQKNNLKSN